MKRIIGAMIIGFVLPAIVLGQGNTTGRIIGRVVDDGGQPVDQARVSFLSPALQGQRVTSTDTDGRFLAALLPVGPYAVSIAAPGMKTVTVSLRVTVGGTEPLRLRLEPGEDLQETITVLGKITPLETTVVGENFNYSTTVEELPIAHRSIETVARLSPNVSSQLLTSDPGRARYTTIAGGTSLETSIQLDGSELNDQLGFRTRELFLEDAVEEVQVLTAGVSARYGRFTGGVINAITKSGGNTFTGTVRAEFSKESWNSRTPFGEEQSDTTNEVYQATLGGYMIKDKLWFFAGGRTIPTKTVGGRTVLTDEDYIQEETEDRWQFKLRGAPAANHTIELSYLDFDWNVNGGDGGQGILPGHLRTAGSRGNFPGDMTTLTYQGVLGRATFLDATAGRKNVRSARGGALELGSPIWDGSDGDVFYNSVWSDPNDSIDRDNETLSANFTRLFPTKDRGAHTLEAGVHYVKTISGGANKWASTGLIWAHFFNAAVFPFVELGTAPGEVVFNVNSGDQDNIRWEDLPLGGDQELENLALFAHDTWQMGKWRVDAGLRWERYRGSSPSGADLGIDADDLAPRLGLTYNLRPDLQLQAFWGKYVARMDDAFIARVSGLGRGPSIARFYVGPEVLGATVADIETLLGDDSNWGDLVELEDPANPTAFLADDLELPYANDLNVSVRYGLPKSSGSITLSVIDRKYRNLLEPQVGDFGTVDVPAPDGPEVLTVDKAVLDNTASRRDYTALAATWDYRPGARWDVGGNWTFSETKGNNELDPNVIGSALGTYERSRPEAAAVPFGPLPWDRTHVVSAWGNYRWDLDKAGSLVLGGIALYESGTTWSRRARVPYSDDPVYLDEVSNRYLHHFDGRGNNEFDDWWSLDVSGRYQFPVRGRVNGWVKATVTNLLDNDSLIASSTSASATSSPPADCPGCVTDVANGLTWVPRSSFGTARTPFDYQRPRSYLFTLGLSF